MEKMKATALSFLMVLTGLGNNAYRSPDGIYIVTLGCLRD